MFTYFLNVINNMKTIKEMTHPVQFYALTTSKQFNTYSEVFFAKVLS